MKSQCNGTTRQDKQCKNKAKEGSCYCHHHIDSQSINTITPVVKKLTAQLQSEYEQRLYCKNQYDKVGLKFKNEWSSAKNKRVNKNADDTVEIVDIDKFCDHFGKSHNYKKGGLLQVNCKTVAGQSTWFNGGTTTDCTMSKFICERSSDRINIRFKIEQATSKISEIKNELGVQKKWSECGHYNKDEIHQELLNTWAYILTDNERLLYDLYNYRLSELDFIGEKISLSNKKEYPPNMKVSIRNHTLVIGDLIIRFKARGSSVNDNWKMNCGYI